MLASTLFVVRPTYFGYNSETASSNHFQNFSKGKSTIALAAINEFDNWITLLQKHHINTVIYSPISGHNQPDAVFPNNWFYFDNQGNLCLFPMAAFNRRLEKNDHSLAFLQKHTHCSKFTDYSYFEEAKQFLEGTGSMVLDRINRLAFCALSHRSHLRVLEKFCADFNYTPIAFHSVDMNDRVVYHTNVMMSVSPTQVILCCQSIVDDNKRKEIKELITKQGKTIIEISSLQMNSFCGNILLVKNRFGTPYWLMSSQAYKAFSRSQIKSLRAEAPILHAPIPTIEKIGGGSIRCMIGEIF